VSYWRERIAAALEPIAAIDATSAPPDVVTVGAAWPTWSSAEPSAYGGPLQTWAVIVVLPTASMVDTIEAGDSLVGDVMAALSAACGEVTRVEPATVATADGGDPLPALHFTLTTIGGAAS
jgi:hypothetical protein